MPFSFSKLRAYLLKLEDNRKAEGIRKNRKVSDALRSHPMLPNSYRVSVKFAEPYYAIDESFKTYSIDSTEVRLQKS